MECCSKANSRQQACEIDGQPNKNKSVSDPWHNYTTKRHFRIFLTQSFFRHSINNIYSKHCLDKVGENTAKEVNWYAYLYSVSNSTQFEITPCVDTTSLIPWVYSHCPMVPLCQLNSASPKHSVEPEKYGVTTIKNQIFDLTTWLS